MTVKEDTKLYKLRLLFVKFKHGLFLLTCRNFLARFGIDLGPYYWVQEGIGGIEPPKIRGNESDFEFKVLSVDDVKNLKKTSFVNVESGISRLGNGLRFIGVKNNGEVAAFMCIENNDLTFRKRVFRLEDDEAYLLNMYTYPPYRGLNLAPYLRYKSYELLHEEGVNKIYSVTDYFNKSSAKFKRKLNAKPLTLYFAVVLFKRFHRTFKIKDYTGKIST
ncbi:GNAT family N-acetyltransferase [Flagellimonas sp. 2504JD4-2]